MEEYKPAWGHEEQRESGEFSFPVRKKEVGIRDVHAEASYHLLPETRLFPSVSVQAEGGAPTATVAGLGTGLWRAASSVTTAKFLHPRLALFATGSVSHFFAAEGADPEPIWSYGGGIGVGIRQSIWLDLYSASSLILLC